MNIWILTIGTSDVQLESTKVSRSNNRQLSDKIWYTWARECEQEWEINFKPTQAFVNENEPYRIPPRALGGVYNKSPETTQSEITSYLHFPLLENFLKSFPENPLPEVIFLLLTDQSKLFADTLQRRNPKCPYWQDTIELEAIVSHHLQTHFQEQHQTEVKVVPIALNPEDETESLDDWNAVLDMVRDQFKNLAIDGEKLDSQKCDRVYVSHQAGTPAISSAVQFCSLAKFGDLVRFIVSNEYDRELPDSVESSSYLRGIKQEQAKKLLENYDYAGVNELVGKYLSDDIKILLEAAIQWNFSNFAEGYNLIKSNKLLKKGEQKKSFLEKLKEHPNFHNLVKERTKDSPWWWTAYESAYLSFIRLEQENTVEAVFHSFRSVESLLNTWAITKYPGELENTKHPSRDRNLRLYGEDLYTFLDIKRNTIDQTQDLDVWIFGNIVIKRRNDLFHNIKGLNSQENVFAVWRSSNEPQWKEKPEEKWKTRILNCLNFIVKEDFPEGFATLEQASLMAQVHRELTKAIVSL